MMTRVWNEVAFVPHWAQQAKAKYCRDSVDFTKDGNSSSGLHQNVKYIGLSFATGLSVWRTGPYSRDQLSKRLRGHQP